MYVNDANINHMISSTGISSTAARLYFEINRCVNISRNRGIRDRRGVSYCYASKQYLADKINRSTRTVARCISELVSAGMIVCKRTKRNAHIYVAWYGSVEPAEGVSSDNNVTSRSDENGTSIIGEKSFNYTDTKSIVLCNSSVELDSSDSISKNSQVKQTVTPQPTRQRTHERKPRITKEIRQKAKERYYRMIANKLGLTNSDWWQFPDEHQRMQALANLLSDALSIPSRQFRINGCNLTRDQYWQVVQGMTLETVADIPDRVEHYRITSGVKNLTGYICAAVYNACMYERFSNGASPSIA